MKRRMVSEEKRHNEGFKISRGSWKSSVEWWEGVGKVQCALATSCRFNVL